ncbi:helix-turn-helix domain-containing protein [Gorillibacterium sp. sgz5001074]|uniref:helix-turn-helix domain-containing protein n=1 Tax=Gorillibacterium sp. sgz5001074 TaxID=3446695 RepID=UPI003F6692B4
MKSLFSRLSFNQKPYIWTHRRWSEQDFDGYYHWHQGGELLFVHRGTGRVIVNQMSYDIRPGMLFFFQPFQLHKVYAEVEEAPYERSIFHFDPAALEPFTSAYPQLNKLLTAMRQGLVTQQAYDFKEDLDYISGLYDGFQRYSASSRHWEEQGALFLLQLMTCIRSALHGEDGTARESAPQARLYSERIMHWVEEHYTEPFELQQLADELHLSRTYVSRIFRRETGSSISDYLTARRIKQACSLLRTTDWPVQLIAERIGMPNPSYFIRIFKQEVGITPYRYKHTPL